MKLDRAVTDLEDCQVASPLRVPVPLRILTNQTRKGRPYLLQRAQLLSGWEKVVARGDDGGSWRLRDVYWAWRLFRESAGFDAVITGWDHPSLLFAFFQGLLRPRRKCHVVIYTKWRVPPSRLKRWLRLCQYRLVSSVVDRFVPLSHRQAEMHAHTWHIPREKFSVLPYHITMDNSDVAVCEGDYIFAGGDDEKDYPTLLKAVAGLPYRVIIAAVHRYHFEGLRIPETVEILTASREQYFQLMARARVVVVPLLNGAVRGGEQTFLNAMLLGKPVIVLSECGADEYITNGESGIVLHCGDSTGLREAVLRVYEDDAFRQKLARHAQATAAEFTPKRYSDGLLEIVADCLRKGPQ